MSSSTRRSQSNDGLFTFKPKLGITSTRLVENMGTDFMSRQQLHIEKQKKLLERNTEYPRNGRLSPMAKVKKVSKEAFDHKEVLMDPSVNLTSDVSDESLTGETSELQPKEKISPNLQRILEGPYANGNVEMALKSLRPPGTSQRPRYSKSRPHSDGDDSDDDGKENHPLSQSCVEPAMLGGMRSKTMPPQSQLNRPKLGGRRSSQMMGDRLRMAKEVVDKAIRMRKVFTIQGCYSAVRNSLRKRGWVEKFYRLTAPSKKAAGSKRKRSADDDDDADLDDDDDDGDITDDDDAHKPEEPKIPPWEEEEGLYGIMSRMVRNVNPTLYWVLKRDAIDYRFLGREQMVNHYCKAGSFTTKVGLCVNMRNVPWFEQADPNVFFPRCYRLSHDEDKEAFIEDYRLTTCVNIIKLTIDQSKRNPDPEETEIDQSEDSPACSSHVVVGKCINTECANFEKEITEGEECEHVKKTATENIPDSPKSKLIGKKKKKKRIVVPVTALEMSITECEKFLRTKDHDDIDDRDSIVEISSQNWNQLIQWFYLLAHENGVIANITEEQVRQCESLINRLKSRCPQLEMDGAKNVWIVKPGAKSRGRGIVCFAKLEEMLKLVDSSVVKKEGKFVVQKYIERPLLIYNTKFDIRQWFLVTDWNPLTLWFYQDCYLRFCSQEYTLDKMDESIHLSNNAIQKNYKNGPRSTMLPSENMWSHYEFIDFLNKRRQGHLWQDLIYPGMKKAIVCALLATQDLVEYRKFSFELYGADFMLTEDYKPWLIEINCSPSMEASTPITAELCRNVLEDTVKVVVDRRFDRNADVGRFELAYKQSPVTVPPYIGLNLSVDGQGIKRPAVPKSTEPSPTTVKETKEENNEDDAATSSQEDATDAVKNETKVDNKVNVSKGTSEKPSEGKSKTKVTPPPNKSPSGPKEGHKRKQQSSPLKTSILGQSSSKSNSTSVTTNNQSSADGKQDVCQNGRKSAGTIHSDILKETKETKKERIHSQSISPQITSVAKSLPSPTSMYMITGGRRIVSKTSVANNYPIVNPTPMQRDRQTLQVNTVDTKSLPVQQTSSAPVKGTTTRGARSGMCLNCGGGVILKRDKHGLIIAPRSKVKKGGGGGGCCRETPRKKLLKRQQAELDFDPQDRTPVLVLPTAQHNTYSKLAQCKAAYTVITKASANEKRLIYWLPQKSLLSRAAVQNQTCFTLPSPIKEHPLGSPRSSTVLNTENPPQGRSLSTKRSDHSSNGWMSSPSLTSPLPPNQLAPNCSKLKITMSTGCYDQCLSPQSSRCSEKELVRGRHTPPPYRPPSAKHPGEKPWASLVTTFAHNEKMYLHCADGRVQPPVSPVPVFSKTLPKVRKYVSPRARNPTLASIEKSLNSDSLTNALSIVSQSPSAKT